MFDYDGHVFEGTIPGYFKHCVCLVGYDWFGRVQIYGVAWPRVRPLTRAARQMLALVTK